MGKVIPFEEKKQGQREVERLHKIDFKRIQGIMMLPAPEPAFEKVIHYAECRHCGQFQDVFLKGFTDKARADEYASLHCNCPEAEAFRKYRDSVDEAKAKRQEQIHQAQEQIDSLFGDGAEQIGRKPLTRDQLEYLLDAATLVIDDRFVTISIKARGGMNYAVSRDTKGNLSIQRADSSKIKREVLGRGFSD